MKKFKIILKKFLNFLPDKIFLSLKYRYIMKSKLNLDAPNTYNEKLQWLKLYDRNPLYTTLVDKFEVRYYVKEKIGEEYLVPIYGIWEKFEDIDFNSLPEQFVLKTTHDSGGVVICKDKKTLNFKIMEETITKSLNRNYYEVGREWPYKNVKPRIIAETYLEDNLYQEARDYKFFCFEGEPKLMFVSTDRGNSTKADFFDMDFNHLDLKRIYPNSKEEIAKPINFEKMKELSIILSENIPHVRVDFYEVNGEIYFGEMTFFTGSGFQPFYPNTYDKILGDWINLPSKEFN